MYSPSVGKAHYKNLMHCDRVWICPVCASKITERRKQELITAMHTTTFIAYLVTYTLRHTASDSLFSLTSAILEAFHDLKSGKVWQKHRQSYGWIGSIRTLEPTYGENGWHPHIHELVLLEAALTPEQLEEMTTFLKRRWHMVLDRYGRDASWLHGVDVRPGREDVSEYIAKFGHQPVIVGWTIESEITKAPTKRGRGEHGRTPHQLLADSAAGDEIAGKLFIEYANVIKGKKQLVWSPGLRELMGLEKREATDEELADQDTNCAFVLAQLTKVQWEIILGNDARGELLKVAAAGDWVKLRDWLVDFGIQLDF